MTIKKVFFDANIFNDIFDASRGTHSISKQAFTLALEYNMKLYTSCDIATNIYYITAKYTTRDNALKALESVKKMAMIIPFGEKELSETISLMRKDSDYKDFEDAIQYILAIDEKCDVIITNDKRFVSKEIKCMSSEKFVKTFLSELP